MWCATRQWHYQPPASVSRFTACSASNDTLGTFRFPKIVGGRLEDTCQSRIRHLYSPTAAGAFQLQNRRAKYTSAYSSLQNINSAIVTKQEHVQCSKILIAQRILSVIFKIGDYRSRFTNAEYVIDSVNL
jgi:hypothetical protein